MPPWAWVLLCSAVVLALMWSYDRKVAARRRRLDELGAPPHGHVTLQAQRDAHLSALLPEGWSGWGVGGGG